MSDLLSLLVQLLNWVATIIGWALEACAVLVCARILLPYLYRKFWRVRIYYWSKDGEPTSHSFRAEDFWHLRRADMVGREPLSRRYYFSPNITPEDVRKELQEAAAREAAERAAEWEKRPKWSLSEQVQLPGFEATWKWAERTFKFFQWLAFAVVIIFVGERTSDIFVSALGYALAILAILPYVLLISEYGLSRIIWSDDSGMSHAIC